jgi:hypothetical protein
MDFRMRFKIGTLAAAAILSWFALATMLSEALTPQSSGLPPRAAPSANAASADWLEAAVPLRGDLLADLAWAHAMPLFRPGPPPASKDLLEERETALKLTRESLSYAPHISRTWLLLAMLRNLQPATGSVGEALKMSYLTAPADTDLVPDRLSLLAASDALDDTDILDLARGDIRLVLTHRRDLKDAIIRAYNGGSAKGRAFIQETTRALDPDFAATMQ